MIICAGESLIDMVSFATENGEVQYTPHVGGSILNSAIALGRLGADTYYCGAVSNDTFGGLDRGLPKRFQGSGRFYY